MGSESSPSPVAAAPATVKPFRRNERRLVSAFMSIQFSCIGGGTSIERGCSRRRAGVSAGGQSHVTSMSFECRRSGDGWAVPGPARARNERKKVSSWGQNRMSGADFKSLSRNRLCGGRDSPSYSLCVGYLEETGEFRRAVTIFLALADGQNVAAGTTFVPLAGISGRSNKRRGEAARPKRRTASIIGDLPWLKVVPTGRKR